VDIADIKDSHGVETQKCKKDPFLAQPMDVKERMAGSERNLGPRRKTGADVEVEKEGRVHEMMHEASLSLSDAVHRAEEVVMRVGSALKGDFGRAKEVAGEEMERMNETEAAKLVKGAFSTLKKDASSAATSAKSHLQDAIEAAERMRGMKGGSEKEHLKTEVIHHTKAAASADPRVGAHLLKKCAGKKTIACQALAPHHTEVVGSLSSMRDVDPTYSCIGFGKSGDEDEVLAVKCKPLPGGACPANLSKDCKISSLRISSLPSNLITDIFE
jgi:hypothetical protein